MPNIESCLSKKTHFKPKLIEHIIYLMNEKILKQFISNDTNKPLAILIGQVFANEIFDNNSICSESPPPENHIFTNLFLSRQTSNLLSLPSYSDSDKPKVEIISEHGFRKLFYDEEDFHEKFRLVKTVLYTYAKFLDTMKPSIKNISELLIKDQCALQSFLYNNNLYINVISSQVKLESRSTSTSESSEISKKQSSGLDSENEGVDITNFLSSNVRKRKLN